jgi:hypothetical protein
MDKMLYMKTWLFKDVEQTNDISPKNNNILNLYKKLWHIYVYVHKYKVEWNNYNFKKFKLWFIFVEHEGNKKFKVLKGSWFNIVFIN